MNKLALLEDRLLVLQDKVNTLQKVKGAKGFNPNQLRDLIGRWTTGGGVGGPASSHRAQLTYQTKAEFLEGWKNLPKGVEVDLAARGTHREHWQFKVDGLGVLSKMPDKRISPGEDLLSSPLTSDDWDAVFEYAGANFDDINGNLRSGTTSNELVNSQVKGLDAVMAKAALTRKVESYRFVHPQFYSELIKVVGGTFSDKGFVSVTMNAFTPGESFIGLPALRVILPKGAKAIPVIDEGDYPEQEIIVNRGSKFRVTRDKDLLRLTWVA